MARRESVHTFLDRSRRLSARKLLLLAAFARRAFFGDNAASIAFGGIDFDVTRHCSIGHPIQTGGVRRRKSGGRTNRDQRLQWLKNRTSPQRDTIRRMFPLLPGVKPENIGKPYNAAAQGEESLKIQGKEYQTTWFDVKGKTEGGESITRTWMCDDVPGRLVKAKIQIPSADRVTNQELFKIEKP